MEKIELFDKYIKGSLSDAQRSEFDQRLNSDADFASEFKVYLLTVDGICREAHQDDLEFGHAMKSLNKSQLQAIIGNTKKTHIIRRSFFRERMMWVSSMAAMLIIAVAIGWNLYTTSQNHLCDVVYSNSYQPIEGGERGANEKEYLNLNMLSNEQIAAKIPQLKLAFESDEVDSQDWHIDGMTLSMAYLKLHQKNHAIEILKTMASKTTAPEVYNRLIEQLQ